jgi:hypothetical protein
MMKPTKKTGLVLVAIGAALICLFILPVPLEGNWQTTTIGCMCDSHHFLRFEDGKVLSMSEHHPPPDWIGTYERIGWGKYKVDMFLGAGSAVVRPKFMFLDLSGLFKTTWRDFAYWKTSRVLHDPAQEWVQDCGTWNIVVRNDDGQAHYYFGRREVDLDKAEQILTRLNREVLTTNTSFVVYADSEGIPMALRDILAKLDVKHEERPNPH